ncbi:MAG: exonuclease domain-containing protein [Clostridia bacterium]|nr:exonuclease domain-containing protein [Clostridia bacterium]
MDYIIFDLEATCWENGKGKVSEIIEIGAVKLNEKLESLGTFSTFVRPVINPILSEFCTKLTTITQQDVDGADTFELAMKTFESWIGLQGEKVLLCSWGFYDKKQILAECEVKSYSGRIGWMLDSHISIKHQFAKAREISPCGMRYALEILGLPLEGTHHRGIDDAKNIAKIFKTVFHELEIPEK